MKGPPRGESLVSVNEILSHQEGEWGPHVLERDESRASDRREKKCGPFCSLLC